MEEFIEILLEIVILLDRLLDLEEKELDVCTPSLKKYITDFRNDMASFAKRLQRKDEKEQPQQEKEPIAPFVISEDEDADEGADEDEGADLYIRRRDKIDRELG